MVQYYTLVKRKGTKKWNNAIPAKKGISISKLRTTVRNQIKKSYTYRIVTQTELKKIISNRIKSIKKKVKKKR